MATGKILQFVLTAVIGFFLIFLISNCANSGGRSRGRGAYGDWGRADSLWRPDPEQMRKQSEEKFERMCIELGLNENQRKEAARLFEKTLDEREALARKVHDRKIERPAALEQIEKAFLDYRQKLTALLDEEQAKKLDGYWERWLSSGM
ncbi:MAG: hypothetical protein A3F83_16325 [Candidatus Glassbacteria bacterium RIFCSPLOWO2_12_FULL_58_11]|uniref:Periplasmic heavy metal sensor n=1 Tax=Candidatus Glassbacteria bacterium RIFCSPLOWO2_12_FULL_58_11 TaxID=1817867 RepID=A0A1F5YS66_9BACT|nr:MAG: hypothetical protein A3F83_16325 [Candidatus Glassbacteria bacterium RIFCSPLOWO2_12_FULL_58_11]